MENLSKSGSENDMAKETNDHDMSIWIGTWNMGHADPFECQATTNMKKSKSECDKIIQNLIPSFPLYDLYVIGVQEAMNENIFDAIQDYLSPSKYKRLPLRNNQFVFPDSSYSMDATFDAVHGRGDGAFRTTKFTGIALFVSLTKINQVELIRASDYKFSFTSGSKGGVGFVLRMKQKTTIAFVNCHLDARSNELRRDQLRLLNLNLGKNLGKSLKSVHNIDLTACFHHVIWMGDLNYRILKLNSTSVCDMLESNKIRELHDQYDGLMLDLQTRLNLFQFFSEPCKNLDFIPTYKKYVNRNQSIDRTKPNWTRLLYHLQFKVPFYKGGKVKERVPGWCDRILHHEISKSVNKLECAKNSKGEDEYHAINDGVFMDISDHSPVTAVFCLRFPSRDTIHNIYSYEDADITISMNGDEVINRRYTNQDITTFLKISNIQLFWHSMQNQKNILTPTLIKIITPLIAEDFHDGSQLIREFITHTNILKVKHVRPLEDLHLYLQVHFEALAGYCVVCYKDLVLGCTNNDNICIEMPLRWESCPVLYSNNVVHVSFRLGFVPNDLNHNHAT